MEIIFTSLLQGYYFPSLLIWLLFLIKHHYGYYFYSIIITVTNFTSLLLWLLFLIRYY
jgi:hypothetical protein